MSWLPPLALALDLTLADPRGLPHPVQGIGMLAERIEGPARRLELPILAGAMATLALCLLSASAVALLCRLPGLIGPAAALYFAWSGLALGSLVRDGRQCLEAIRLAEVNDHALPEARRLAQMLVSRDASDMGIDDLYRALAESVSENLNDAFAAPWFWLCLTGPAGLWVYKTVSTLDSMWGYKNERFIHFGKAAARLDDILAFIPARLCVPLMLLTVWLARLPELLRKREHRGLFSIPGWPGFRSLARQARQSASPNAGWPMATAAWLFNGRSGGPTVYGGLVVDKPLMGPDTGRWQAENTLRLIGQARWAGVVCGLLSLPFFFF